MPRLARVNVAEAKLSNISRDGTSWQDGKVSSHKHTWLLNTVITELTGTTTRRLGNWVKVRWLCFITAQEINVLAQHRFAEQLFVLCYK